MNTKCVKIAKKPKQDPKLLLTHIIATTLDDDLMDKFKLPANKRRLLRNFQCEYYKTSIEKEFQQSIIEYDPIPTKNTSHQDQRNYARKCPKNSMYVFPKKGILKLVPTAASVKFSRTFNEVLGEVCDEFLGIIHNASVNCKTTPLPDEEGLVVLQPLKYKGKTPDYHVFLRNRKRLQKRWQLNHKLILDVVKECEYSLPDILFDMNLLPQEPHTLEELNERSDKNMNSAAITFSKLYEKISTLIYESPDHNQNILNICNTILSAYFTLKIMSTIDHLVIWASVVSPLSYLKFNVLLNECLSIEPTIDDVVSLYSIFIYTFSQIANEFDKFGCGKQLPIVITDDYFDDRKERIRKHITRFYMPIFNYLRIIDKEFAQMYNKRVEDFDTLTFEFGCELIENYQEYYKRISDIVITNKYITIGQLTTCLNENLKQAIQDYINDVFQHLTKLHQQQLQSICNEFETMKQKFLETPQNTEELILQGKYVVFVKATYLNELIERIQLQIDDLIKLIQFGSLTEDHIQLNSATIFWIKDIEPYIELNSITYEQLKGDAEDRMFEKVHTVTRNLNDLYKELNILNVMDDFEAVREYLRITCRYNNTLLDIQANVNWINTEETLLSYRRTSFDKFTHIVNFLLPFMRLLKVCLTITRKINVWLYGPFEFLDSDEAEEFVETTMETLLQMEKSYRDLLRKQEADLRFEGFVDHPDVDKWPTPLRLIRQAVEKLEEFQPCLKWMRIWCDPTLTKQQWKEMSEIAGVDLKPNAGTTLKKLMDLNLSDIEAYQIIFMISRHLEEAEEEGDGYMDNNNIIIDDYNDNIPVIDDNYDNIMPHTE